MSQRYPVIYTALMGNVGRLKTFARSRSLGENAWGNEVKNSIELSVPTQDLARRSGTARSAQRECRCSIVR
jgi:hypothetical protein